MLGQLVLRVQVSTYDEKIGEALGRSTSPRLRHTRD